MTSLCLHFVIWIWGLTSINFVTFIDNCKTLESVTTLWRYLKASTLCYLFKQSEIIDQPFGKCIMLTFKSKSLNHFPLNFCRNKRIIYLDDNVCGREQKKKPARSYVTVCVIYSPLWQNQGIPTRRSSNNSSNNWIQRDLWDLILWYEMIMVMWPLMLFWPPRCPHCAMTSRLVAGGDMAGAKSDYWLWYDPHQHD